MTWSQCSMYREPEGPGTPPSNDTVPCQHGWVYAWDTTGESSTVSEWDLVCDQNYLSELALTLYYVGATCGTVLLTPLSDRFGRKTVMLACLWSQSLVGVAVALTPIALPFIVLQFFIGITNMTIALCAYVLIVETFDRNKREWPALSLQFFWAGGIMLLSLLAYLLPNWRHLELAVSLPQLLTISYFWLLPESLTWLLDKGRIETAKKTIIKIMRVNKLPPFENLDQTLDQFRNDQQSEKEEVTTITADSSTLAGSKVEMLPDRTVQIKSYTVLDLFKTPRIRRYSIFMFYLYLVNSLAYFGISFSTPLLNGNKYLNNFISGAVEVPAYIVCIIFNRRIGRRWPICGFLLICAVANVAVIFTPDSTESGVNLSSLKTTLVMVGKFGITGSYSALYLYGSEIFPTAIRNHAVGLCSFFENIGSIAAPQVVYAAKTLTQLPMTVFAVMTVVGAVLVLFLPETHNASLPQTLEDCESWGKSRPSSPAAAFDLPDTNDNSPERFCTRF